jgi:hypothetical protein
LCFLVVVFVGIFGDGATAMVVQGELKFIVVFLADFVLSCCGVEQFHVLTFEEENELVELRVWVVFGV